jgi:hypothetical protein
VEVVVVATRQVVGQAGLELEAMVVVEMGLLEQPIAVAVAVAPTIQHLRMPVQPEVPALSLLLILIHMLHLYQLE